jgi:hypothetical protein
LRTSSEQALKVASGPEQTSPNRKRATRLPRPLAREVEQYKKTGDQNQVDAVQKLVNDCIGFWEASLGNSPEAKRRPGENNEDACAGQERPHDPKDTGKVVEGKFATRQKPEASV